MRRHSTFSLPALPLDALKLAKTNGNCTNCEPKSQQESIFEDDEAGAFAGSVRAGEKGLALVNLRGDLVDRESWNTISIKAEGDRVQVWLNGEEVGAVRAGGPRKGKIGFYIGAGSAESELCIREVQVQKAGKTS